VEPLDGVVQLGAAQAPPDADPVVTFDERTIVQALACGDPAWHALSPRERRARIEMERRSYARAAACCTTTSWAAHSVVHDYGIPRPKVHAVGVGGSRAPAPVRRDWGLPRFLFVAKDGQPESAGVLRAFARLRRRFPEARLDVVGEEWPAAPDGVTGHGPLRRDVPEERRHLRRLLRQATCFVMLSQDEPSALGYVEASAAGVAGIVSAAGGLAELVGDGGLVVDPADDEALLAAMEVLARADVAARLGEAAGQRSQLFTWDSVAERILRAFALPALAGRSLADFL
jgi:hypothetical protein